MKMRRPSLRLLFLGGLLVASSLACSRNEQQDFKKVPSGGTNNANGAAGKTSRLESTDLLFEQVSHAHHAIGILLNRTATATSDQACVSYLARPGKRRFLTANYSACEFTEKTRAGTVVVAFSGNEEFFESLEDENLQATAELIIRVTPLGNSAKVETYTLRRQLVLDTVAPAAAIPFQQTNRLDAEDAANRAKQDSWVSEATGTIRAQKNTNGWSVAGIAKSGTLSMRYAFPFHDTQTRKIALRTGRLRLTAASEITFTGGCANPSGRFDWVSEETGRAETKGSFETDDSGIKDPTGTDTELQKPRPWAACTASALDAASF